MAERTSTCETHTEREIRQVYMYVPQALSFISGRSYPDQHLRLCWIRHTIAEDQALLCWPPRWPDITPRKFFFWGYVKDSVFLLPLPHDLPELRTEIIPAISGIDCDMLQLVWVEMDYWLDVCHVTRGGHIQHL